MKLQTEIPVTPESNPIDYTSEVLLLGSCFAENMADKFEYYKFLSNSNPFGILFHPAAIEQLVTRAINLDYFTDVDCFEFNDLWSCFAVHSDMSAKSREEHLEGLNSALRLLNECILKATHVVCTYGTAWVYRHIANDTIVANCHKVPQKRFLKELLSPEAVEAYIDNTEILIRSVNPNAVFIHTVSPVRHTKDGMVENTRSKAHLLTGLHQVLSQRRRSYYFPAYEMMMDELRDYRYYAEDLVHPSKLAISIIWERFVCSWLDPNTTETRKEVAAIQQGLAHRSLHPESDAHKDFLASLHQRIGVLQEGFPYMKF